MAINKKHTFNKIILTSGIILIGFFIYLDLIGLDTDQYDPGESTVTVSSEISIPDASTTSVAGTFFE